MKKNLRIVSAAAAALLAVAPVAASAVSVNAANTGITNNIGDATNWGVTVNNNANVNVSSSLQLTVKNTFNGVNSENLTGGVSLSVDGQNYAGLFAPNYSGAGVYRTESDAQKNVSPIEKNSDKTPLTAGKTYYVNMSHVSFNLGPQNANKTITLTMPEGGSFQYWKSNQTQDDTTTTNGYVTSHKVFVKSDGTVSLGNIILPVTAADLTNPAQVNFFNRETGAVVHSGDVSVTANASHQLNVATVAAAINRKYAAAQVSTSNPTPANAAVIASTADVTAALKSLNVKVDDGYFTAPASFTVNVNAKSDYNNATATMPVTVNVANAAQTPAAQETTKNVTIMHIAAIYDKNGVATHDPALRAYDTYSVVAEPVTINNAKFYKLAGKDQYIKVGNVDGTSRTLKHNSYVYKSTGKRANKKTLKKGSSVTTYGKSFMIAGHQMYRIGKNQYVKKANF